MSATHLLRRVALVLVLALVTGCGSQLDPDQVASANAGVSVPTDTTRPVSGEQSPGAVASDNPGAPGDPGTPGNPEAPGNPADPGPGTDGTTSPPPGTAPSTGSDPSAPPADHGVRHGSCEGFHNQTGITDRTITIANASDISGPIPGIFASTQEAVQAYADYFNATSSICGRKLSVLALDTRTDAGADQQAYSTACQQAFSTVGSMAAFDSGGASVAQQCGLPDLRSAIVNGARNACSTCFGAQSGTPNTSANVVPDYFVKTYPDAARNAGYLYIQAGPAVENASDEIQAWTRRGMHFTYTQGIDVSEFNYAPYVEQLKDHHVQLVRFLGAADQAVRLQRAMAQQGYHPQVFLEDAEVYDQDYVNQGGADVDGTRIFVNFTPFEDAGSNPELALYLRWLQEAKPGATPTFEGLFAWSAARLFTEQALQLGGRLTRASLVKRLDAVRNWTDNGLHAPQQVGTHVVGPCWRFLRLDDGHWVPEGGTDYRCGGVTTIH